MHFFYSAIVLVYFKQKIQRSQGDFLQGGNLEIGTNLGRQCIMKLVGNCLHNLILNSKIARLIKFFALISQNILACCT